ncbi:MAG: uracil phosphoribosyltransferase [Candidatus Uhrbacteria bacterium]
MGNDSMGGMRLAEDFPEAQQLLGVVRQKMREAEARRCTRLEVVKNAMSTRGYAFNLDRLRVRMAERARRSLAERGGVAFVPLADDELAFLDRQMETYGEERRLRVMGRHGRGIAAQYLNVLRVNYLTGRDAVSGDHFRFVAREMLAILVQEVLSFTARSLELAARPRTTQDITVMIPWRAALLVGEVYRQAGATRFWHLGAKRDEQTLETEVYYDQPLMRSSGVHVVTDPMLATGGTDATAIDLLLAAGIEQQDIVVQAVVAAPEGVNLLLHKYPGIRIVTVALDERLDQNGYIVPGLGDFGDLAMRGVDEAYADRHWIRSGLLSRDQVRIILDRTRAMMAGTHVAPTV